MSQLKISYGNNMPVQAPLIPDPFVPYQCLGNRTVYAVCRGDENVIRSLLEPTPFEFVEDRFVVSIVDFSNCDKVPFMDAAIVVPVGYKDILGGNYIFEYENNDAAIAAGRELWGYPKKYARISLEKEGDTVTARVIREGEMLMEVQCVLDDSMSIPTKPKLTPHLNIHAQPAPDGPGVLARRIIARDTSSDFKVISERAGETSIRLGGTANDPLDLFESKEILGGGFIVGDFYATEKNGWGKIIDTLESR
ncbi:MAG: acetoacetate decarboxylase family protein [Gammaproteobacteria bacterium]|nr:acetoacetate decarboxylase family protein [Gammaproteobacteria bacterium]